MTKAIITLTIFSFLCFNSFGQIKWSISKTNDRVIETINKLERKGYVIKKVSISNNEYLDPLRIEWPQHDSLFIMAMTISPVNNTTIIDPKKVSLSLSCKKFSKSDKSVKDTVISVTKEFGRSVDNKTRSNVYTWTMHISPTQTQPTQTHLFNISLDEEMTIGTIAPEDLPKGNTPEEKTKNAAHRQCILIVYSRS
jgi:hypothetical protein